MAIGVEVWLQIVPETLDERAACGGLVDAMRKIAGGGFRDWMIQVERHGRNLVVKVREAPVGTVTIPPQVLE
jgi:hypothetical protein